MTWSRSAMSLVKVIFSHCHNQLMSSTFFLHAEHLTCDSSTHYHRKREKFIQVASNREKCRHRKTERERKTITRRHHQLSLSFLFNSNRSRSKVSYGYDSNQNETQMTSVWSRTATDKTTQKCRQWRPATGVTSPFPITVPEH